MEGQERSPSRHTTGDRRDPALAFALDNARGSVVRALSMPPVSVDTRPRPRRTVAAALLLSSLAFGAGRAAAAPDIVNGLLTSEYPTVGVLLRGTSFDTAALECSGTLIGCRTFLTAGHCVEGDLNPVNYQVFLQHGGFFHVSSIALQPTYNFPVGDVAVLTLSTAADGIAPTPINTAAVPGVGSGGTIVGFGRSGGGTTNNDYGLKRVGDVTTAACPSGVSSSTSVCWTFANPLGPPGTDSNTCNGDSGGPLFIDFGSGATVAGVTSGGSSDTCLPTDESYDANVHFYRTWIAAQAGSDLNNTTCGTLAQVGTAGASIHPSTGALNSVATQGTATVDVPAGSAELRVALNAIDDGSDFDLYVRAGSPPTTTSYDCKADGPNQFGYCRFVAPVAGPWHILVNRFSGAGTYQVTATLFGVDCSLPANAGAACDDGNACTTTDRCVSGNCVGSPVSDGQPCADGALCTHGDTCQAGTCAGTAAPRTDCRAPFVPARGAIDLQRPAGGPQKLKWAWNAGSATTKTDFGDPTGQTDYALCIYDAVAGTSHVVLSRGITGGSACGTRACWSSGTAGFAYRDTKGVQGPLTNLLLHAGVDGKAHIILKGKGALLGLPGFPIPQPSTLTVQLDNGTTCWETRYTTSLVNTTTEFKARQ